MNAIGIEVDQRLQNKFINADLVFIKNEIKWFKTAKATLNNSNPRSPKWFDGGEVNFCYDCLDKHLDSANQPAFIIYDNDKPLTPQIVTYIQLSEKVLKFTNLLGNVTGINYKRVLIILPQCVDAIVSILTCLRLGLTFSVMKPNFMECMLLRLLDFQPDVVITANGCKFDKSLSETVMRAMVCMQRIPQPRFRFISFNEGYDMVDLLKSQSTTDFRFDHDIPALMPIEIRPYSVNQPLCVAYTAGSTGAPKGCVHSALSLYMSCLADKGYTTTPKLVDKSVSFFFTSLENIVGLVGICLQPLLTKAQSVLYEADSDDVEPDKIYHIIKSLSVTSAYIPIATLEQLKLKDPYGKTAKSTGCDNIKLKVVFTSGLDTDEVLNWTQTLFSNENKLTVFRYYGITELGGLVYTPDSDLQGDLPDNPQLDLPSLRSSKSMLDFINAKILRGNVELKENQVGDLFIKFPLPPMMMSSYHSQDDRHLQNFEEVEGYYALREPSLIDQFGNLRISKRTDLDFNEEIIIPFLENNLQKEWNVKKNAVICTKEENVKKLYAFFQTPRNCLGEVASKTSKMIKSHLSLAYGSFIHLEVHPLLKFPLMPDGRTTSRDAMKSMLEDPSRITIFKGDPNFNCFIQKVREIKGIVNRKRN